MSDDKIVYPPEFSTEKVEPAPDIRFTDHHYAKCFVDDYGDNIRYVVDWKMWITWNDVHWAQDDTGEVKRAIRLNNRELSEKYKSKSKEYKEAHSVPFAERIEKFAKIDQRVVIRSEDLDKDPLLMGTPAGVIDLRTGLCKEQSKNDYITKITAYEPADKARCPQFLRFVLSYADGRKDLARFWLTWAGYNLTGSIEEHCMVFAHGEGRNGKSVWNSVLLGVLGDYATTASSDLFMVTSLGKHPTDIADLEGYRCIVTTEVEPGQRLRMGLIKQITGGERLKAHKMRQDNRQFAPRCKVNTALDFLLCVMHDATVPLWTRMTAARYALPPCDAPAGTRLVGDLVIRVPSLH
jgi:putative DNA primase/helicase